MWHHDVDCNNDSNTDVNRILIVILIILLIWISTLNLIKILTETLIGSFIRFLKGFCYVDVRWDFNIDCNRDLDWDFNTAVDVDFNTDFSY